MAYCLPTYLATRFRKALKNKIVSIEMLSNENSSEERRMHLEDILGDEVNAKKLNELFESKILLKNQKKGLQNFIDRATGVKENVRRDMVNMITKMETALNPANKQKFLADFVAKKLGATVTMEEAKNINKLANEAQFAKITMEASPRRKDFAPPTETERDFGKARWALTKYVNKLREQPMGLKDYFSFEGIKIFAGIAKSAKSTWDNSALLRQNLKPFWTNPKIWFKNARESFNDIRRTFNNEEVMDEVMADIISRPRYESMLKDKLAIGTIEEEHVQSERLEKIPVYGKIHKAAEVAFTAMSYRMRADLYDLYAGVAEGNNQEPTGEGIGTVVNAMTGRGKLGGLEGAADWVNVGFFSLRFLSSNVNFLTAHAFDKTVSPTMKHQARKNLLKIVIGTAAVLGMAYAIDPETVEWDSRSANFGKIKIGNTRFDVTGGMGSIAVLASRLFRRATKSSTSGLVKQINTREVFSKEGSDLIWDFFENKFSPTFQVIKTLINESDFEGNKPTTVGTLQDLFVPIIIEEFSALQSDPNSANTLLALIAEGIGIGVNTYSAAQDWTQNPGAILQQFRDKVGEKRFLEANEKFNENYTRWLNAITRTNKYQNLSNEEKQKEQTSMKNEIKSKIFRRNNFKYKRSK